MPSDFVPDSGFTRQGAKQRGARSHLSGMAAETAVARRYLDAGYALVATRKRCPEGNRPAAAAGRQLVAVE